MIFFAKRNDISQQTVKVDLVVAFELNKKLTPIGLIGNATIGSQHIGTKNILLRLCTRLSYNKCRRLFILYKRHGIEFLGIEHINQISICKFFEHIPFAIAVVEQS